MAVVGESTRTGVAVHSLVSRIVNRRIEVVYGACGGCTHFFRGYGSLRNAMGGEGSLQKNVGFTLLLLAVIVGELNMV